VGRDGEEVGRAGVVWHDEWFVVGLKRKVEMKDEMTRSSTVSPSDRVKPGFSIS